MLKSILRPQIIIAVVLSLSLLGFVLSLSDLSKVMGRIQGIPIFTMLLCLGLAVAYLALKGFQLRFLLEEIEIPIPWKPLVFSFAIGEMSIMIPGGVYVQNYLLGRTASAAFSRSSAATTAVLLAEATVALTVVAVLGIPGWQWLRPAILAAVAFAGLALSTLMVVGPLRRLACGVMLAGPFKRVGWEFLEMVKELGVLAKPRVVLRFAPLSAAYLLALVSAFYLVGHAVGQSTFTFQQAATVYLLALSVVLVSPISSHVGVIEATGLGAMQAWGYSPTEGMTALLGFRIVWTGAVWLACGSTALLLRGQWR